MYERRAYCGIPSLGISSFFLYTYDIFPIAILVPLFLGLANRCNIIGGYRNGEDKKIRPHIFAGI